MKQGIEKIMQERWGFAHHQKTMLVDQDWHGQRYLTAYMGMHFKLSNVGLLVIGLLYMAYPDGCRPQIRFLSRLRPFCMMGISSCATQHPYVGCHCVMFSYFPVHMPIVSSVHACICSRVALHLGPADQHALVLSLSVSVSVTL
jgi:hypothetical protein